MNTFFSKIVLLSIFLASSFNLLAHVELDYPVGGETLIAGNTITIQWHISIAHNTIGWDLYYSPDSGANWEPIEVDMPPTQLSYQWLVPSDATTHGRIRIFQNNTAQDYLDISDDFTIQVASTLPFIETTAHDTTIQCSPSNQETAIILWLTNHGGAHVSNFCGTLNWTNNFDGLSNGCGSTGNALVTFTASDGCGSTSTQAELNVTDNTLPILQAPASNLEVETNGNGNTTQYNAWLVNHGGAQSIDACSAIDWTYTFTNQQFVCGISGYFTVMFIATDECGNYVTTEATFTIEDTQPPVIDAQAQDTAIACGLPNQQALIQSWLQHHGGAHAADAGGNIAWTHNFQGAPDTCGTQQNLAVTFVVSDECGNTSVSNAIFTILESVPTSTTTLTDGNFIIFPNPSDDHMSVLFDRDNNRPVTISLIDACGKIIWSHLENAYEIIIPLHDYATGIYFLQINTGQDTFIRKVVIE